MSHSRRESDSQPSVQVCPRRERCNDDVLVLHTLHRLEEVGPEESVEVSQPVDDVVMELDELGLVVGCDSLGEDDGDRFRGGPKAGDPLLTARSVDHFLDFSR